MTDTRNLSATISAAQACLLAGSNSSAVLLKLDQISNDLMRAHSIPTTSDWPGQQEKLVYQPGLVSPEQDWSGLAALCCQLHDQLPAYPSLTPRGSITMSLAIIENPDSARQVYQPARSRMLLHSYAHTLIFQGRQFEEIKALSPAVHADWINHNVRKLCQIWPDKHPTEMELSWSWLYEGDGHPLLCRLQDDHCYEEISKAITSRLITDLRLQQAVSEAGSQATWVDDCLEDSYTDMTDTQRQVLRNRLSRILRAAMRQQRRG